MSPRVSGLGREPVPEQSWWSIAGSSPEAQVGSSDPETRALGRGLQCQELRQDRFTSADDQQVQRPVGGFGERLRRDFCAMLPRWILPGTSGASQKVAKACQGKRFLSLFGGAA